LPEWLTLRDAADHLGISISTLRRWTDAGLIPVTRTPGGHRRYELHHLERFLSARRHHGRDEVRVVVIGPDYAREEVVRSLAAQEVSVQEATSTEEAIALLSP
jgi:excisionase family DNA binding protein